jgi:hypothetical protein
MKRKVLLGAPNKLPIILVYEEKIYVSCEACTEDGAQTVRLDMTIGNVSIGAKITHEQRYEIIRMLGGVPLGEPTPK